MSVLLQRNSLDLLKFHISPLVGMEEISFSSPWRHYCLPKWLQKLKSSFFSLVVWFQFECEFCKNLYEILLDENHPTTVQVEPTDEVAMSIGCRLELNVTAANPRTATSFGYPAALPSYPGCYTRLNMTLCACMNLYLKFCIMYLLGVHASWVCIYVYASIFGRHAVMHVWLIWSYVPCRPTLCMNVDFLDTWITPFMNSMSVDYFETRC